MKKRNQETPWWAVLRDAVVLNIPIRVVSESNQREHWAKKARRVKEHRKAVNLYMIRERWDSLAAGGSGMPDLPLRVTFTRIAPRPLDRGDNLPGAFKACRDSVAAFYGVDDADPRWTWCYDQRRGKPKEYAVEIRLGRERAGRDLSGVCDGTDPQEVNDVCATDH